MKAAAFVLGVQTFEIMGIAAVGNNLITYVINEMHFSLSKSANIVTNFIGTLFILALLGGYLSDSYLGCFWTILIFGFVELSLLDYTEAKNSLLSFERTLYPYVTGTSVVAIKYKDGILMAADMGGSYGSTLRYKSVERMKPVGKHSLLGASGEISDLQEILRYLDELILHDNMWDDGNSLGPKEVHNYLTRLMYNRRNKFNPLWNSLVLGGVKNGHKYLGTVSMIGVHFEDNHVATGFGNHLARPILRDEWKEDLTFEEGVKLLEKCMRVLLYRDRSAVNKLQIAKITEEGVTISQPYALKTFWGFRAFQNPTVGAEGSW